MTTEPEYDDTQYDFDLDALEDKGPAPEPFRVKLAGQTFEFRNPRDMSWQETAALDDTESGMEYMQLILGEDRFAEFVKHEFPMWKLESAIAAWRKHFGLTEGKAVASSRTSNGTAKRSRRTSSKKG